MQNTKLTKLNIKNMRKSTTDEQSPAFQFYASDWISSPDRMRMSLENKAHIFYCIATVGVAIEYYLIWKFYQKCVIAD